MLASPRGPSSWLLQTRPLTQFTFWLNYLTGGTNPFGYHLFNLLLHVAVVCLLYQVLREFVTEEIAFAAAALFAIHPIQSEPVAYIFARSSLLATLFCLLSWRALKHGRTALAIICFAAALLSKEECVTFPFVVMLIGPRLWKPLQQCSEWLSQRVYAHLTLRRLSPDRAPVSPRGSSPLQYLASQGDVILRYFRLLAVPWGFTIDPEIRPQVWAEVLAWTVVIAALVYFRKNRWFIAGMILLIPSSSIFPASDLAADRRMYLPLIAFSVAMAPLLWPARYVIAPVLILLSIGRMEVWRTERTLWQEAVERSPGKARPRIQLARAIPPQEALDGPQCGSHKRRRVNRTRTGLPRPQSTGRRSARIRTSAGPETARCPRHQQSWRRPPGTWPGQSCPAGFRKVSCNRSRT